MLCFTVHCVCIIEPLGVSQRIVFQSFYCGVHTIFISWLLPAIINSNNNGNTHNYNLAMASAIGAESETAIQIMHRERERENARAWQGAGREQRVSPWLTMCDNQWQFCRLASCHTAPPPPSAAVSPIFPSGPSLRCGIICCFWRLRAFRKLVWENYFSTGIFKRSLTYLTNSLTYSLLPLTIRFTQIFLLFTNCWVFCVFILIFRQQQQQSMEEF